MQVMFESGNWIVHSTYAEKDIPKGAGCRWDPKIYKWWTNRSEIAARLLKYCDSSAREAIADAIEAKEQAVAESKATDADIDIPRPDGLEYMAFQKAGIAYAVQRVNTLIADEMGLGKTIQAIGYMNATGVRSALVLCPASLKINWGREIKKWLVADLSVGIADEWFPNTDIVICNYDILKKYRKFILQKAWQLMVLDEVHYLKNYKTMRTKNVFGYKTWLPNDAEHVPAIKADHILALTGTPICNRPIELWGIIKTLDPKTWNNWKHFTDRYCGASSTKHGVDVTGATNLPELQRKLRETCMVRRMKADVLKDLPPKRRQVIVLPHGSVSITAEQQAYEKVQERIATLKAAVELAKAQDDESYRKAMGELSSGLMVSFDDVSRIRHDTAVAKIPVVVDHIKECMEEVPKIVIFCHHKDVVNAMQEQLAEYGVVRLVGDDNQKARQEAVDRFQNDPDVRVFIGSITAAGVGITLTAATHVVFSELDWVPGNLSQAEDRCHRIGQLGSVTVQHIVLEGSIDEKLAQAIIRKQEIIEKALNGGGQNIEDAIKPVEYEVATTESTSKQAIAQEAELMTEDQIEAVHEALRMLTAMDQDHARVQNSAGYSKVDGRIGHSLSNLPRLSPKQAALGRRIAMKYRRQIGESLIERMKK